MDDNKKVTFSDCEIEGIAKAIALADLEREKSEHSDDKGRTFLQSDSQSKIRGCL